MTFRYEYKVKTSDVWQASMYYTYSSYLAVINIICIISSIVLMVRYYSESGDFVRFLLLVFLALFTVIQPLIAYVRAASSLNGNYPDIVLEFSEKEIRISSGTQTQIKHWKDVKGYVVKPTIVIIYMGDGNGYILRNGILKDTKKEFCAFLGKMNEKKSN